MDRSHLDSRSGGQRMRHTSTPPQRRVFRGVVDDIHVRCGFDLADHCPSCEACPGRCDCEER